VPPVAPGSHLDPPGSPSPSGGPATDARGTPVRDPSPNVLDVVRTGLTSESQLRKQGLKALRREQALHIKYNRKLAKAESSRVDAIHAADEAARGREAIVNAAQTAQLAKQVTDTAEAVRISSEQQRTSMVDLLKTTMEPVNKSLAELTKALYSGEGAAGQRRTGRDNSQWLIGTAIAIAVIIATIVVHFLPTVASTVSP
jgi:hypothetical protein